MIIRRDKYISSLLKQKDKDIIKVITGIRGSGKLILLFDLYFNELINMNVPKSHIIKIAFDNIKNVSLLDAEVLYEEIEKQILDKETHYIFLDEIQLVKHFEDVVNGIKRDFKCAIYITGSNSEFLSSDVIKWHLKCLYGIDFLIISHHKSNPKYINYKYEWTKEKLLSKSFYYLYN